MALTSTAVAQTPRQWKLEPIATIEGPSADDPFGVVRGLALHADGRLVVTESNPRRISMYDSKGKSLGVVGRIGGGPAEYRNPYSTAWLADTLAIYDPGESRVLYLTQAKTHLRVEKTPSVTGPTIRFFPVSRTKAYLQSSLREGDRYRTAFLGVGGPGKRDTVIAPDLPSLASGTVCKIENGGIRFISWPQAPMPISFPVRPDGAMALGNTGQYDVRVQLRGNAVASITRKEFVPIPLNDATWRMGLGTYQKHVDKYGSSSCDSSPVRPPNLTSILAMTVADNGDIWVTVRGKEVAGYDVFAPDGKLIASINVPKGARVEVPIVVTGDRLVYVTEDHDGVQLVNYARIAR